jgi:hypothetical protein
MRIISIVSHTTESIEILTIIKIDIVMSNSFEKHEIIAEIASIATSNRSGNKLIKLLEYN